MAYSSYNPSHTTRDNPTRGTWDVGWPTFFSCEILFKISFNGERYSKINDERVEYSTTIFFMKTKKKFCEHRKTVRYECFFM